jgi:hypothetical protein
MDEGRHRAASGWRGARLGYRVELEEFAAQEFGAENVHPMVKEPLACFGLFSFPINAYWPGE